MFGKGAPAVIINVQAPSAQQPASEVEEWRAALQEMEKRIMAGIDNLEAAVAKLDTVTAGVAASFGALNAELKAVQDELAAQGVNNARLDAAVAKIDADTGSIAGAIAQGTAADPAATEPAAEPTPPEQTVGTDQPPADIPPAADPAAPTS